MKNPQPPGTCCPRPSPPSYSPPPLRNHLEPDPHQTLGTASPNSWGQASGDTVGRGHLWGTIGSSHPWLTPMGLRTRPKGAGPPSSRGTVSRRGHRAPPGVRVQGGWRVRPPDTACGVPPVCGSGQGLRPTPVPCVPQLRGPQAVGGLPGHAVPERRRGAAGARGAHLQAPLLQPLHARLRRGAARAGGARAPQPPGAAHLPARAHDAAPRRRALRHHGLGLGARGR